MLALALGLALPDLLLACPYCAKIPEDAAALKIEATRVVKVDELDSFIFEVTVEGEAGSVMPEAKGELDGAPVLGYVFPTNLKPSAVGFGDVEGVLALAATSHPDFDDTPLWDENADGDWKNDGRIWHTHWVVLHQDERIGSLSVRQFDAGDESVKLPPTNPGMPMYMDSPGFSVVTRGSQLRIVVPANRIREAGDFRFDAVVAFMQVNTSDKSRPMLGVYKVYSVASGDLSLPFEVETGKH
ncbi:hypothetical protein VDG1235_953 [Verrucomicrobiia bacterium DG1235]|nr:hypothetical protein VDG1235_953 [Verrucomicrobiae bacterium DG1235]